MIKVHGKPVYVETALFKDVLNELSDIKGNRLTYPISKEEGKKRDILIGKYLEENYPSKKYFFFMDKNQAQNEIEDLLYSCKECFKRIKYSCDDETVTISNYYVFMESITIDFKLSDIESVRGSLECFEINLINTRIVIYNGYIAEYNGTPLKNYKSKLISIPIAATLCLVVYFISDKNKLAVMFCNMIFFTTILNALEIVFTDKGYSDGQIVILGFVACWMTVICCFLCT